jgi:type IX secretion system PorP/SprF family membrane protein
LKNLKNIYLLIFVLHIQLHLFAQDPHYSQFFASPLTLNPANTGNFNGSLRVATNIRNQLSEFQNAYSTKTISLDAPIFQKHLPTDDKLSVGLLLLTDQSGNKLLNDNNVALSLSYTKALDENANHFIAAGFQANYSMYRFDPSKANFEDQLTAGGFSLSSAELILGNAYSKNTADVNAGILYTASTSNNNLFYVGASYYHFAKPAVGFTTPAYFTAARANLHGGTYINLSYSATLHASFQYQHQGDNNELLLGGALSYYIGKDNGYEIYAGLWSRIKESLIPYVGIEWNHFRAGFSFDVGAANQLAVTKSYQSSEFSLLYIFNNNGKGGKIKCPKF